MPRDLLHWANGTPRIDTSLIYQPFLDRLLRVLAACRARGADYYVTSGTRLWPEQEKLHALWVAGKGGRAAPAGHSAHQWGLAVDVTRDANLKARGLQPTWAEGTYDILVEEVEREGLHSGKSYGDLPHVSWPGFVSARDLAPLRAIWERTEGDERKKLQAVWAHVDRLAA